MTVQQEMSSGAPPPVTDLLVATKVGEFIIEERIGSGGMGVVYRAVHPLIGKQVAIKVLRAELVSQQQVERLMIEGRAVNAIRHPGIIDIFGFGSLPDGRPYITMELLRGDSLSALIRKQGRLDANTTVRILDEMLAALDAAHQAGVVHRDLKPGNVFMVEGRNGSHSVKLVDFGIAKLVQSQEGPTTLEGTILGTPEFMAPEQIRGAPSSPAADLYAVGVIAFQMLTGERPFKGEPFQVLFAHVEQPAPAPSSKVPGIPPELDTLVLQLLAKEPSLRPQSAEAVRQALQRVPRTPVAATEAATPVTPVSEGETLTMQAVRTLPSSTVSRGPRWMAGVLLFATLGGGTYLFWPDKPDDSVPTVEARPEARAEAAQRPDAPVAEPAIAAAPPVTPEPDVVVPAQTPESPPPDESPAVAQTTPIATSQPAGPKKAALQGDSREPSQTSKTSTKVRQAAISKLLQQVERGKEMLREAGQRLSSEDRSKIGEELAKIGKLVLDAKNADDDKLLQALLDSLQKRLSPLVQEQQAPGAPAADAKSSMPPAPASALFTGTDGKPDPFKKGQLDYLYEDEKELSALASSSPVDPAAMAELHKLIDHAKHMQTQEQRIAFPKARRAWEQKYLPNLKRAEGQAP